MKILFVHNGLEFDGDAVKSKPLGGTETALIGVSQALAKISGVEVIVCTNTPEAKVFDQVQYLPLNQLANWSKQNEIDVLISIRQWLVFCLPIKAKYRVYFSPDAYNQPFVSSALTVPMSLNGEDKTVSLMSPKSILPNVDSIFCVGQWQADGFVTQLGLPQDKIWVTGNAIFPKRFAPQPLEDRNRRLMYSSTPFRGLEFLPDIYKKLKNEFSDLELEVCSGLKVYGLSEKEEKSSYSLIYDKLKAVKAISHGSINQIELAKIMCQNLIYTYPNIFAETFCISVLEAQAAGLPVVTSDLGALKERIDDGIDGFLIKGQVTDESYQREFIEITSKLIKDPVFWNKISHKAIKRAASQTYESLAQKWMDFFNEKQVGVMDYKTVRDPQFPLPTKDLSGNWPNPIKIEPASMAQILKKRFHLYGF